MLGLTLLASNSSAQAQQVALLRIDGPHGGSIRAALRQKLGSRYHLVSASRADVTIGGRISRGGSRWVLRLWVSVEGKAVGATSQILRGPRLGRGDLQLTMQRIERLVPRSMHSVVHAVHRRRVVRSAPRAVASGALHSALRGGSPAPRATAPPARAETRPPAPVRVGRAVVAAPISDPLLDSVAVPPSEPYPDEDEDADEGVRARGGEADDDLGFATRGSTRRLFQESFRIHRHEQRRQPWETIFEASAGVMALSRRMSFDYPESITGLKPIPDFRSGVVPALQVEGALYPLATLRGPLSNLGLVGRYYRVLSLKYHYLPGAEPLRTTLHMFEVGLRYRYNFLARRTSPTLSVGVEFGRLAFVVWDEEGVAGDQYLPNLAYLYLKLALARLDFPLLVRGGLVLGLGISVDYLQILSAGRISVVDEAGAGPQSRSGVEAGGGAFGSYGGFFLRVAGFYRQIFYSFDDSGGAKDVYSGGMVNLGYAY